MGGVWVTCQITENHALGSDRRQTLPAKSFCLQRHATRRDGVGLDRRGCDDSKQLAAVKTTVAAQPSSPTTR